MTGTAEPLATFDGQAAVLKNLERLIDTMARAVLVDKQFTVSDDGQVVFMEAKGDLVQMETSTAYNNVYIFKFTFKDGKIAKIIEYTNPITVAKFRGRPIG